MKFGIQIEWQFFRVRPKKCRFWSAEFGTPDVEGVRQLADAPSASGVTLRQYNHLPGLRLVASSKRRPDWPLPSISFT